MSRERFKQALQEQRRVRHATMDRFQEGDRVRNTSTGKTGAIDRVLGSERYNVRYASGVLTQGGDQLEPA